MGGGGGGFRILNDKYGDSEMTKYIFDKLDESNNIDFAYEKIYNNYILGIILALILMSI